MFARTAYTHGKERVRVQNCVERDVGLKRVSTIINGEEWNPDRTRYTCRIVKGFIVSRERPA